MLATAQPVSPTLPAMPEPPKYWIPPAKRQRRTATGVLAGWFEERPVLPGRDALTALLNGVSPVNWQAAVRAEHERRGIVLPKGQFSILSGDIAGIGGGKHKKEAGARRKAFGGKHGRADSFYSSISHPADGDGDFDDLDDDAEYALPGSAATLPATPGGSVSSSTPSLTSSRRPVSPFDLDGASPQTTVSPTIPPAQPFSVPPQHRRKQVATHSHPKAAVSHRHTRPRADLSPSDGEEPLAKRIKLERSNSHYTASAASPGAGGYSDLPFATYPIVDAAPPPRIRGRKRAAAKKGWKGWVEVEESEAEPESLIKLDAPPQIKERRTRSGKAFDAIAVGDGSWV